MAMPCVALQIGAGSNHHKVYSPYPLFGSSTELRGPDNDIDVSDMITYQK
jgi:hypothetical protein